MAGVRKPKSGEKIPRKPRKSKPSAPVLEPVPAPDPVAAAPAPPPAPAVEILHAQVDIRMVDSAGVETNVHFECYPLMEGAQFQANLKNTVQGRILYIAGVQPNLKNA